MEQINRCNGTLVASSPRVPKNRLDNYAEGLLVLLRDPPCGTQAAAGGATARLRETESGAEAGVACFPSFYIWKISIISLINESMLWVFASQLPVNYNFNLFTQKLFGNFQ